MLHADSAAGQFGLSGDGEVWASPGHSTRSRARREASRSGRGKGPGGTYTSCVAPQPTALEAEISPSVQREFLA